MEDKLIEILEDFNYPVYRQGSLAGQEYPDDFFTFWNSDSPDHAHYDNADYGTEWSFSVNFYSNNPLHTYEVLGEAIIALKAAGFIADGKGYDVQSDEITHTGRGVGLKYLETPIKEVKTNAQDNL